MENQAHGDAIRRWKGIGEEVARGCRDAVGQSCGVDRLFRDGLHHRQIEARAAKSWISLGEDHAELACCPADIAKRVVPGEVELLREQLKVAE